MKFWHVLFEGYTENERIAKVWQLDARTLWGCDATVASE